MKNKIELLSPAKNLECAIAAIDCGADAVYMGASSYGARKEAANSVEDIALAAKYAHSYGAKLYVTLNTMLLDAELENAHRLAWELYEAKIDALIIQDLGLINLKLPPIELHASTQCHINSLKKAKFLEGLGFSTLVLARELDLKEIAEIANNVSCKIEVFAHGSLCVSYSGQCYLSCAIGRRSGNRGECAQPCRKAYELIDSAQTPLAAPKHYLSLKDMQRANKLSELLDAGVSSFKIEGRLKDASYVKNITAFYRQKLDSCLKQKGLEKSSLGFSQIQFKPDPNKSFSRTFTEYNLDSNKNDISSFDTPKSKGEFLFEAKKVFGGGFFAEKNFAINNGDGLFIENPSGNSFGAAVQRVDGAKVRLNSSFEDGYVEFGAKIWRNKNLDFEKSLQQKCSRKIPINLEILEDNGVMIFKSAVLEKPDFNVQSSIEVSEFAQNKEAALEKLKDNLSKLGESKFCLNKITFNLKNVPQFKTSQINQIRRELCISLEEKILKSTEESRKAFTFNPPQTDALQSLDHTDFRLNIANKESYNFYKSCGVETPQYALECGLETAKGKPVMRTLHCILRPLGFCKKQGKFPKDFQEPIYLKSDEVILRLNFDCENCGMDIFYEGKL